MDDNICVRCQLNPKVINKGGKRRSYCRICWNADNRKRWAEKYKGKECKNRIKRNNIEAGIRESNKKKLIDMFGGKCQSCGYNKNQAALEFHHRNPEEKLFDISKKFAIRSEAKWLEIVKEAEKCHLLCANCHREITHKELNKID